MGRRPRMMRMRNPARAATIQMGRWPGSVSQWAAPLTVCTPATGCYWPRRRSSVPPACSLGSQVLLQLGLMACG